MSDGEQQPVQMADALQQILEGMGQMRQEIINELKQRRRVSNLLAQGRAIKPEAGE